MPSSIRDLGDSRFLEVPSVQWGSVQEEETV
jgi:hypothetical protein